MKVLIVGLGLIGGSYALGLSKNGYEVYGVDTNCDTIKYALENNIVSKASYDAKDFIKDSDMIIIGLYPKMILEFLDKYKNEFRKGQIITDVCGIKTYYLKDAIEKSYPATYIGHHPMAGREKSGIAYANTEMFKKANFLICDSNNREEDINKLKDIAKVLEFDRITVISPQYHDKMIGFTSQLTHAIAVSLVNSDSDQNTKSFIGDSYRDLTRIAMINEHLWSELFLLNKDFLIEEIENFELELNKLKLALIENDESSLKEQFIKSRIKRSEMEK